MYFGPCVLLVLNLSRAECQVLSSYMQGSRVLIFDGQYLRSGYERCQLNLNQQVKDVCYCRKSGALFPVE
jgi:hypothetical protein